MQGTFKHFDKDKSKSLGVNELMAAAKAVDVELSLEETEDAIKKCDTAFCRVCFNAAVAKTAPSAVAVAAQVRH